MSFYSSNFEFSIRKDSKREPCIEIRSPKDGRIISTVPYKEAQAFFDGVYSDIKFLDTMVDRTLGCIYDLLSWMTLGGISRAAERRQTCEEIGACAIKLMEELNSTISSQFMPAVVAVNWLQIVLTRTYPEIFERKRTVIYGRYTGHIRNQRLINILEEAEDDLYEVANTVESIDFFFENLQTQLEEAHEAYKASKRQKRLARSARRHVRNVQECCTSY